MSYTTYRKFNELWLDKIPEHWERRKIKYTFTERVEKGYRHEPLLVASQNMGVVPKDVYGNRTVEATKDLHNLKLVRVGDFVISLRSFQGGLEYAYYQGIISPAYTVMIPNNHVTGGYFRFLAKSEPFIKLLQMCVTGIREGQSIDYNRLKNYHIPLPPRNEQEQIVRYLDWKMSQINKLINAKRRQVELLREEIDILVSHAVAGVKEKMRLKTIVNDVRNWIERDDSILYSPIGVLNRGRGVFHKERLIGSDLGSSEFFKVEPNTLMISGQFAWEGAVAITSNNEYGCIASHRYYSIRGKEEKCNTEYLWALFQTDFGKMLLNLCSHGAAGRNKPLNFTELMNEYIPVPPIETQVAIANNVRLYMFIRTKTKVLEQLLNEYRARLISNVVTGKHDVRGIVVPKFEAMEDEMQNEIKFDELDEAEVV